MGNLFCFSTAIVAPLEWFGNMSMIVGGFIIGLLPYLLPSASLFSQAYFWFTGLFAIGAASAAVCFSPKIPDFLNKWGKYCGWISLAIYALVIAIGGYVKPYGEWLNLGVSTWMMHALVGFATAALLVFCCHRVVANLFAHSSNVTTHYREPIILRLLQSRFAVVLGAFSCSLYLTHELIFNWLGWALDRLHLSVFINFSVIWCIGVPGSLMIGYFFHLAFEKPFTSASATAFGAWPASGVLGERWLFPLRMKTPASSNGEAKEL